jgi:serine/threonine protein kinase
LAPLGCLSDRLRDDAKDFLVVMLVEYGRQISEGMNYLAEHRFVHRDLAARNVFVISYEQVSLFVLSLFASFSFVQIKIGDFGLARRVDAEGDSSSSVGESIPVAW